MDAVKMSRPPETKIAARGSLQADVLADLVALRRFMDASDRALQSLFKRNLSRSHLRNELLRMVVIEFGFGRFRTIAYYQRACAHLDSPSAVRGELQLLAELGLVLYIPAENDRYALQVGPSQSLIDWYSDQLPRLMADVELFISARKVSR